MIVNEIKNIPTDWGKVLENFQKQAPQTNNAPPPDAPISGTPDIPHRPPPDASDSAQVKDGLDNINGTQLLFSVDLLINLLFELALKQRDAQSDARMADATAAEQMGMAAAQDLRDEAAMAISGAIVSSTAQIIGAATVIGGGIRTARTENVMEVSNKMMTYQAVSQTFGASGNVGQGSFQYGAKQDEAQKALHDASAAQSKSLEESDNQSQQDEVQLIQSIIQLQEKQEETRHEAMRATA